MGRKAFITSDISTDEEVIAAGVELPISPFVWSLLLTSFDDWGRAEASAVRIKAKVFPMFVIVTIPDIERSIEIFGEKGLVTIYEVAGKRYMAIHPEKWFSFQTHIRMEKRRKDESRIPACVEHRAWFDNERAKAANPAPSHDSNCNSRDLARDSAQTRDNARDYTPSPSPSPSPSPTDIDTLYPSDTGGKPGNQATNNTTQEATTRSGATRNPGVVPSSGAEGSEGEGEEPPAPEKTHTPLHLFTLAFRERYHRDPAYRNRKHADAAAARHQANIGKGRYAELLAFFFSPVFHDCRPWYCSDGFTWDAFSGHFDKVIVAFEQWEDAGRPESFPPSEQSQRSQAATPHGGTGSPRPGSNPYEFAPNGRRRTIQEQRIAEQQDTLLQEAKDEISRIYDGNPPPDVLKMIGKGSGGIRPAVLSLPAFADVIDADFKEIRH